MMVIPTESHVTLTYGRTAANTMGQTLEVLAWALLIGLSVWRFILWRRRRRLAVAVLESEPGMGVGVGMRCRRGSDVGDRALGYG